MGVVIWAISLLTILLIVVILGALQWVRERVAHPVLNQNMDMMILEVLSEAGLELTEAQVLYKSVCRRANRRLSPVRVFRRFAALRQREWVHAWRTKEGPVKFYYVITPKGRRAMWQLHEAAVATYDQSPFASFRVALGSQRSR